jgi:hypothetical protein
MTIEISSGVRNPALRRPGNADPIHSGVFLPLGPVDGRGGVNISGPYEAELGWPQAPDPASWRTGSGRGIYVESPDRIVAVYGGEVPAYEQKSVWGVSTFRDLRYTEVNGRLNPGHRQNHEILVYDRAGKIAESWDQWTEVLLADNRKNGKRPKSGHVNRIRVNRYDPQRSIWLVGLANNGVFKISNDGQRLEMKIDAESIPEEYHPFIYAQDVAFMPDGDILVGHLHHIFRFDEAGAFKYAVGGQGLGPLQFDSIHDLQVHPETLDIYVNDRVNQRVQVLDKSGDFITEWGGFQGFYSMRLTADGQYLWGGNGFVHKFLKYSLDGRLVPQATWGTFGIAPGAIWGPHWFDTDLEGNLYVAEDYSGRIQKFRPASWADPADPQLIGPLAV